jgi:hypothetical protein
VLAASIIRTLIALMMEAANTYEKSVNFCKTTRRNIPEGRQSVIFMTNVNVEPAVKMKFYMSCNGCL